MDSAGVGFVSACTALVASIVGPWITLTVAKRQFNATVLSTNRYKWIETLRDMLAEFTALIVATLPVKARWKNNWDEGRGPLNANPALLEKLERILLAQSKIRLLINPAEADHQRLNEAIEAAFKHLQSEETLDSETHADIEAITGLAQSILKREWLRVKLGI
jgi:hypothetical protein